jgi:chemotaxis protein histidine kinase CheA
MEVQLKKLVGNPFRDLKVDPIDRERVEMLKQSIMEDGFWGGVVCRQVDSEIQIVAGHHRVKAAIAAGITKADVLVKDMDDEAAVRIYSRENATHRGNQGTAQIGSVAAALRWVARSQLVLPDFRQQKNYVGGLGDVTQNGIGQSAICNLLKDVPGISATTVETQLANLKTSGAYTRIVEEVAAEIEVELLDAQQEAERRAEEAAKAERQAQIQKNAEAEETSRKAAEASRKAAEEAKAAAERAKKAEKAKGAAKNHTRTFDLEGVRKLFQNDSQLNAFRNGVVKTYKIPVEKQRALAEKIVGGVETSKLSADYITKKLKELVDPPKDKSVELEKFIHQIMQPYAVHGGYPGQDLIVKCSQLTPVIGDVNPVQLEKLADFIEELFDRSKKRADETVAFFRRVSRPKIHNVTSTQKKLTGEKS